MHKHQKYEITTSPGPYIYSPTSVCVYGFGPRLPWQERSLVSHGSAMAVAPDWGGAWRGLLCVTEAHELEWMLNLWVTSG